MLFRSIGVVFGGLLVSAAVGGVVAWSRRKYTPRLFLAAAGIMLAVTLASAINAWPATQAIMPTEIPLAIQILGAIGVGLVALVITSSLAGLALGAQPARMTGSSTLPDGDALLLGGAAGAFGAALLAVAGALRTPEWAETVNIAAVGSFVPALAVALDPLAGFLTRAAVLLSLLVSVHHVTLGWTRRRMLAGSSVVYTPSAHFSGVDSLIYTLSDGNGGTASGTVIVTVGIRLLYLPMARR